MDASGNFVWVKQLGGPTSGGGGFGITLDASNNIYTTGEFSGTVDFEPDAGVYNLTDFGNSDIFVHKMKVCIAPTPPTNVTPPPNLNICAGNTTNIMANGSGTINWYTSPTVTTSVGSGTLFTTPSLTTNTIFYAEAYTCAASATRTAISVTVNPVPTISVNSGSICSGASFTIIPGGAVTYTFSSGSAIVSPTANTNYSVTGTSSAGCVSTVSAISNVTVNPIPILTVNSSNNPICAGKSTTLSATGANTYSWNPGPATQTFVVNPALTTNYSVAATNSLGCIGNSIITVTVNSLPVITATVSANPVCAGSFIILQGGGNPDTYTWVSIGVGQNQGATPMVTTTYTLTGMSFSTGCSNSAMVTVSVNPLPAINTVTSSSIICTLPAQQTATLTASGANTYTWNPGGTGTSIAVSPTITTNYTVTGTGGNGCTNSSVITQSVSTCTEIHQPVPVINEIAVYPNPFNDKITVVFNLPLGGSPWPCDAKQPIQVFNALGSLVYNSIIEIETLSAGALAKEETKMDLSFQPSGIYFLRIGALTKKIIKE